MQFFIYLQNYLCFCFILPLGLFWFSRISELLHYHNTTTPSIKFLMFPFEKGIFPYLFKGNLFWFKWGSNSFLIFDQQTLLLIVYGHVFFYCANSFIEKHQISKKWAQLSQNYHITIKNWHDFGFYHYLPHIYLICCW